MTEIERLRRAGASGQLGLFFVQVRRRIYGFDPVWGGPKVLVHSSGFDLVEDEDCHCARCDEPLTVEALATEKCNACGEYFDLEDFGIEETGYQDEWHNLQPFFTREGAEAWRRANDHRVGGETRVFQDSYYDNREWMAVLERLRATGGPCV